MRKPITALCMTALFILPAQTATAGTRIYVDFGLPVVLYEMEYENPCGEYVWIEGYYCIEHPRRVWVPGHWVPAYHHHNACLHEPSIHHYYHCAPHGIGYGPPHGRPDAHGHGNDHYRHEGRGARDGNHGHHDDGGHGPTRYRSGGNWSDNVHETIRKRQGREAR